MNRSRWSGWSCLAFTCLLFALGPAIAVSCPEDGVSQVGFSPAELSGFSPTNLFSDAGFPALSDDGLVLAVLQLDDFESEGATVYLVDLSKGTEEPFGLETLVLFSRTESGLDEADMADVGQRVDSVNRTLCSGVFRPLEEIYDFSSSDSRTLSEPRVQSLTWSDWEIRYDSAAGDVTVYRSGEKPKPLVVARPTEVQGPRGSHPYNFCLTREVPLRAWADQGSGLLLFRLDVTCSCKHCFFAPRWLIEKLP